MRILFIYDLCIYLFPYLFIDYQKWFTFGTTEFVGSRRTEMLIRYKKFVRRG